MSSPRERRAGKATRAAIARFVAAHWEQHGYGPTHREVVVAIGHRSLGSLGVEIAALVEDGVLLHTPRKARTLRPGPALEGV